MTTTTTPPSSPSATTLASPAGSSTSVLGALAPAPVWRHFEALCAIPRPSKKEERVAEHVAALARSWGLEVVRDGVGNVIVKKPASPGREGRPTVVLQAHLDMVPQKAVDSAHDFARDPIRPRVDGEVVRATGTTLGADDGIGVSVALAVLESKTLVHGPLEALFTVDEETGMTGAKGLKPGQLSGSVLLNLDSEDEGEICIGCAGGVDVKATLDYREAKVPAGFVAVQLDVGGLKGGHSGVDIHLARANANKVLARVLYAGRFFGKPEKKAKRPTSRSLSVRLVSFAGGDLRNAIPRSARAVVVVKGAEVDAFVAAATATAAALRAEFADLDPGLTITVEPLPRAPRTSMGEATSDDVLRALIACPHGMFALVPGMSTVAETSTNLAIVTAGKGRLTVANMARSSVDSRKHDVARMLRSVFELIGATVEESGGYPGWRPEPRSPVLSTLQQLYQRRFGAPAKVTATHGGLECGIIRATYPHMDAVSIGPTVRFPHSPDEHVVIGTVQRFWDFLVDALAAL